MQSSSPYHECDTDCFSASQDFSLIPLPPWLAEDITYVDTRISGLGLG